MHACCAARLSNLKSFVVKQRQPTALQPLNTSNTLTMLCASGCLQPVAHLALSVVPLLQPLPSWGGGLVHLQASGNRCGSAEPRCTAQHCLIRLNSSTHALAIHSTARAYSCSCTHPPSPGASAGGPAAPCRPLPCSPPPSASTAAQPGRLPGEGAGWELEERGHWSNSRGPSCCSMQCHAASCCVMPRHAMPWHAASATSSATAPAAHLPCRPGAAGHPQGCAVLCHTDPWPTCTEGVQVGGGGLVWSGITRQLTKQRTSCVWWQTSGKAGGEGEP